MDGANGISVCLLTKIATYLAYVLISYREVLVNAEVEVVPLWDVITSVQNRSVSCHLTKHGNGGHNKTMLTGDPMATCRVEITTFLAFRALIEVRPERMPFGTFVHVENQGKLERCQNRYTVLALDAAPCYSVLLHPHIQLSLQGNASLHISEISIREPSSVCAEMNCDDYVSEMANVNLTVCEANEFNHAISCQYSTDFTCILELQSDCKITLGKYSAHFECSDGDAQSPHAAMVVYPDHTTTLHISGQNVTRLNENAFTNVNLLERIDMSYNKLSSLNLQAFSGLQTLRFLHLQVNKIESLHPRTFLGLYSLLELDISYNALTSLPLTLLKDLNNLQILDLRSNRLISLDRDVFNETGTLAKLVLSDNLIQHLPADTFSSLKLLRYLNLNRNSLENIPDRLFRGLHNLTYLVIDGNKLSTLPSTLFHGLGMLSELHISRNQLVSLSEHLFKDLINLIVLHIHTNRLTALDVNVFKGTRSLQLLSLSINKIALPNGIFDPLAIPLKQLMLTACRITALDKNLFSQRNTIWYLSLNQNLLKSLPKDIFHDFTILKYLFLHENKLESLDNTLFQLSFYLQVLTLQNNMIGEIPRDLFWNCRSLGVLNLATNRLEVLDPRTFQAQLYLSILRLQSNRFKALDVELFKNNTKLSLLDLSFNQLTTLPDVGHLTHLAYFNLLGTQLTFIDSQTFVNVSKKVDLIVNQTEVCECYVPNDLRCTAVNVRSPYLTCDRLLSDRVLMAMMWLIGVNAVGGNLFVLSQKMSSKIPGRGPTVQAILLKNLAASDLLMGVYMLTIAVADIYFGNNFPMQAETWRSGITCRLSGALSIVSSEASVLFLMLISIDRFINIRFPYSQNKLRINSGTILIALTWLISLILGLVPSLLAGRNHRFYDNSHVCIGLPLAQVEQFSKEVTTEDVIETGWQYFKYIAHSQSLGRKPGLYYASALFLGLNSICFLVILICYVEIVRCAIKTSRRAGVSIEAKKELRMALKVAAIVLTDFICWSPVIVLGILVQCNVIVLPASVFAWCVTFVLPINSAINPYLYTIAAVVSERRKKSKTVKGHESSSTTNMTNASVEQSINKSSPNI